MFKFGHQRCNLDHCIDVFIFLFLLNVNIFLSSFKSLDYSELEKQK
jgi:hypothetical protein